MKLRRIKKITKRHIAHISRVNSLVALYDTIIRAMAYGGYDIKTLYAKGISHTKKVSRY